MAETNRRAVKSIINLTANVLQFFICEEQEIGTMVFNSVTLAGVHLNIARSEALKCQLHCFIILTSV